MDLQNFINIAITVGCTIFGIILKVIWDTLQQFQNENKEVVNRISAIEVLVAGEYVRKDEFKDFCKAMFVKLDRIDDKISGKMDKTHDR